MELQDQIDGLSKQIETLTQLVRKLTEDSERSQRLIETIGIAFQNIAITQLAVENKEMKQKLYLIESETNTSAELISYGEIESKASSNKFQKNLQLSIDQVDKESQVFHNFLC